MLIQKTKLWFKFFLNVKINFKYPKKTKILIVDNEGSKEIKKILNIRNCEILHTRHESFSLPILLILLIKFELTILNYYKKYIELSDPKLIVTFIDNNTMFYKLKNHFKEKKFLAIQNGHRMAFGDIFGFFRDYKPKKKNFSSDFIATFNKSISLKYEKYINTNFIYSGSIKNNYIKISNPKKKYNNYILYISAYREKLKKIQNGELSLNDFEIRHKTKHKNYLEEHIHFELPRFLQTYCERNNLKLAILGMSNTDEEKNFYKKIINNDFKFIEKINVYSSYKNLDNYNMVVSSISTLGYEALSRGNKICFFVPKISSIEKSYNFGWPSINKKKGFFFSNKCNYLEVSKILDNIRSMKSSDWKKKIGFYQKKLMIYDKNNFLIKKKISNILSKNL